MSTPSNFRRPHTESQVVAGLVKRPSGPTTVVDPGVTNNRRRLYRGGQVSRHAPSGGIPAK